MIVADTSALMAILLEEDDALACRAALADNALVLISAGTLAESLIVSERRGVRAGMDRLLVGLELEVEPVTPSMAGRVANAYARWGKGAHPVGLNFGDCFAYALADERNLPLLYVGGDFVRTDVQAAIDQGSTRSSDPDD